MKKLIRPILPCLVIIALVMTSVGSGSAIAFAASSDSTDTISAQNKNVIIGIAALGLLAAVLSGHHSKASATATPPATTTPPPAGLTSEEMTAFNLLNADRQANGLQPLKLNLTLSGEAGNYAQDMINRNYFSHTSPEGLSPLNRVQQAGVNSSYVGENLAMDSSVAAAETALMSDAGHRANILNTTFTDVGIGVRHNASGQVYVVQDFVAL